MLLQVSRYLRSFNSFNPQRKWNTVNARIVSFGKRLKWKRMESTVSAMLGLIVDFKWPIHMPMRNQKKTRNC